MNFFNVIFTGLRDWCKDLGQNTIFLMFLSVLLVVIAVTIVAIAFSIENRTSKSIMKVEEYLTNNPFVTNENIVEFNRLMKKIPRTLRTKWQQYVVNRDKKPSDFFNEEDCIEKPFKTRGFSQALVIFRNFLLGLVSLSFIFSACAISSNSVTGAIQECLFTPLTVAIIGVIFIIIVNAVHNKVRANMYFNFKDMTKLLDRAVTTFPDVVDYEILFTKKEIDAMIPELQEYLRQRAVYEQEQLEKAKENEVEHENYDFSSLGIDGSLVMERAMKECEYYLGNRRKALASIEQLQSEKDLLTKSYDEKNKVSQRKLRDINETLDRLREKLNNTTNKIVGNDIRRQQTEEIKKQQNIEREIEEDNNRYQAELKKVDDQINSKKQDIDNNRHYVEVAFTNEFKAYADKVYEKLHTLTEEQVKDELEGLKTDNQNLKSQMEEKDTFIIEKNKLFDEKMELLSQSQAKVEELNDQIKNYEDYKNQVETYLNQKDGETSDKDAQLMNLSAENAKLKNDLDSQIKKYKDLKKQKVVEIARCFDVNGNEFFYDEEGVPYYVDETNNKNYYYSKNDMLNNNIEEGAPKSKDEMTRLMQENSKPLDDENNVADSNKVNEEDKAEKVENVQNEEPVITDTNWQDSLDDLDDEESNDNLDLQETPVVDKDWSYEKFWADTEPEQEGNTTDKVEEQKDETVDDQTEQGSKEQEDETIEKSPEVDTKQEQAPVNAEKVENSEDDDILDEFPDLIVEEDTKQEEVTEKPKKVAPKKTSKKTTSKTGTKKTSAKKTTTKKATPSKAKTKKVENPVGNDGDNGDVGLQDLDLNFDDFNDELNSALNEVDKKSKK